MTARTLLLLAGLCIASLTPSIASAQVFHLKDGRVLEGRALGRVDDPVVHLETLSGRCSFSGESVERVEDLPELRRSLKRLERRIPTDRKGSHDRKASGPSASTGRSSSPKGPRTHKPHSRRHQSLRKQAQRVRALCMLSNWCRQKGLYDEMFGFFDRLAEIDDEHPVFRKFVGEMATVIDYRGYRAGIPLDGGKLDELLNRMSRSGPTLRAVGGELIRRQPRNAACEALVKALESKQEPLNLVAIELAARLTDEATLEPLIGCALLSTRPTVREAARSALNRFEHDGIIYPFLRALRSKNDGLREHALMGLAGLADLRTAGSLISHLGALSDGSASSASRRAHTFNGSQHAVVNGFDAQVANSAAIAKPIISVVQEGVVLDVNLLGTSPGRIDRRRAPAHGREERRLTAKVLKTVTGQDYGEDVVLWLEWWKNNKARILGSSR